MGDRVGFIGLGRMGAAMAANLAHAGLLRTVYNRTADRAFVFGREHGVAVAEDPADLASRSDVIITMVADDVALRDIMWGPAGVLVGLAPGSLVIDMGTVGWSIIGELGGEILARGGDLLDAPVSGMPLVAQQGRLTVMVGGDAPSLDRARPILAVMAERIIHVGGHGAGAAMKLAINTAIHGLNQAVSEALVLAERAGIDRSTAYEVFVAGAISGPFVVNRRGVFEQPGVGPQPFSMRLAAKDVRLALDLASDVGAPLEQAALNLAILERAAAAGLGELDESAVAVYLRGGSDGASGGVT